MRTNWFLGVLFCSGLPLLEQTVGEITGRVSDLSGASGPRIHSASYRAAGSVRREHCLLMLHYLGESPFPRELAHFSRNEAVPFHTSG